MGSASKGKKIYAVVKGRTPGIYYTWPECEAQVKGVPATYKSFPTLEEAQEFIATGGASSGPSKKSAKPAKRTASEADVDGADGDAARSSKAIKTKQYTEDGVRIVEAYTDGASAGNGKVGAKAGWGVHWPEARADPNSDLVDLKDESARLPGELQTNNRAELMAIVRALQLCSAKHKDVQLRIFTDSSYSIKAITEWQYKWRQNKWMLAKYSKDKNGHNKIQQVPVSNRDLIRRLIHEMRKFEHRPELIYVKGHSTSPGNREADRLAVAGAQLPELAKTEWPTDLEPPPSDTEEGRLDAKKDEPRKEKGVATLTSLGFTKKPA